MLEQVSVDGLTTNVSTAGPTTDETAVVFLHGNPGTGQYWDRLIALIGDFARCVAPDLPGYGSASQATGLEFSVDGYVRYLDRLLEQLGVRRAHLVGHDLGGIWALGWAARDPSRVASLVLMSVGVLPGYRWHRYARLYRVPLVGELLLMSANRRAVSNVLRRGSSSAPPDDFVDAVVRQYHDPATRRAVLAFYRGTPDLGAETVRAAEALHGRDLPVLVVWGAGDPYVPAAFAERQRDYFPNAQLLVLPGSGHWPMEDSFSALAEVMVPFLRQQLVGAAPG
jgi:pimeloyl-ACP methyl ester carboxylesterase